MRIENDSRVFLSEMLEEFTPNIKLRSKMNDIFGIIQIDKDHGQINYDINVPLVHKS